MTKPHQPKRPELIIRTGQDARALRAKLRMTQQEFWARAGTKQSGGSRYESQGRGIPDSVLTLLTLAYGSPRKSKKLYEWLKLEREKPAQQHVLPKIPSGRLYTHAQQFFDIAELAFADCEYLSRLPNAIVMNYAFSAEMFMKACEPKPVLTSKLPTGEICDALVQSSVQGHDLVKVFSRLDKPTQERLEELFHAAANVELMPLLETCQDYFVDARYQHDNPPMTSLCLTDVRTLAKGLKDGILNWSQPRPK